jgi:putative ABC transport system permease protein
MEQLLLSTVGGTLGLGIAWAALALFVNTAAVDLPRVNDVALDARVVAFAAGVSTLAGLLVALLPAWRMAGRDMEQSLRAGALSTTADRGGMRTRGMLLALQIALSLTLLVVTALLGASFIRLMNVDRGFAADRVLVVPLSLPAQRYASEAPRLAAYDRVLASVRALPGVQNATTVSVTPLTGSAQASSVVPDGSSAPRSTHPTANFRFVGPEFFRTLGVRIVRGRLFADNEGRASGAMPALLSDRTAERLWPGENPIGKRFSRGIPGEAGFEVVGVVADAKITSLDRTPPLMVYVPYWWRSRTSVTLLIKTAIDPPAMMPPVRRALREIDPDIAIGDARPLERIVDASVAGRRYQMQLFLAFGAVALFIATLGVYAVTSYGVSRRRREMNIRVALGAQPSQVMRLVLGQATVPIAAGVVAGTGAALALGTVVASLLFDVRARDPFVLAGVATLVAAVGLATSAIAARHGLRLDPASALRDE